MVLFFFIGFLVAVSAWSITTEFMLSGLEIEYKVEGAKREKLFWDNFPSFIILLLGIIFLIMIGGLYAGHIVFMCVYKKTTNESLKRSEKYGFLFSQFQTIKPNSGFL